MAEFGIGASVLRKEDDPFLRGRGQYVGGVRMAGMREVALVRSPPAHARRMSIAIPAGYRDFVFTADNLVGVKANHLGSYAQGFKCQTKRWTPSRRSRRHAVIAIRMKRLFAKAAGRSKS